jgi:hypothetical protein
MDANGGTNNVAIQLFLKTGRARQLMKRILFTACSVIREFCEKPGVE